MKNSNSTSLGKHKSHDSEEDIGSGSEAKKPKLTSSLCELKAYAGERKGEREDMQDAHTIIDDFTSQFPALPNNMYVS
jgi:integrin-linked kinase-associated serine/threonine phosphatase 2C